MEKGWFRFLAEADEGDLLFLWGAMYLRNQYEDNLERLPKEVQDLLKNKKGSTEFHYRAQINLRPTSLQEILELRDLSDKFVKAAKVKGEFDDSAFVSYVFNQCKRVAEGEKSGVRLWSVYRGIEALVCHLFALGGLKPGTECFEKVKTILKMMNRAEMNRVLEVQLPSDLRHSEVFTRGVWENNVEAFFKAKDSWLDNPTLEATVPKELIGSGFDTLLNSLWNELSVRGPRELIVLETFKHNPDSFEFQSFSESDLKVTEVLCRKIHAEYSNSKLYQEFYKKTDIPDYEKMEVLSLLQKSGVITPESYLDELEMFAEEG